MVLHNEYLHQPKLPCLSNLRSGVYLSGVEGSVDLRLILIMLKVRHQSDSDILKNLSNQESDDDDDDDDDDVIIESQEEPIDSG